MNKKGFTLIELSAVIIILGIIVIITFPVVKNTIYKSNLKLYETQIKEIERATSDFLLLDQNIYLLPEDEGNVITITLADLKRSGVIEVNIKDPRSGELFPNDLLITITRWMNQFSIDVVEDSGTTESIDNNLEAPTIVLNGNYLTYVELNEPYVDQGAYAYSMDNIDLTNNIVREIYNGDNQVLDVTTSNFNTFVVKYIVVDQNKNLSSTALRTVIVRDTKPPIISFDEEINLTISEVSTFNPLENIIVTDNSSDAVEISYEGEVLATSGRYLLTYSAKDKSGNIATKKRIVKVN